MSFAGKIRGVLLDITGVLKEGDKAISGSIEGVSRLRAAGLQLRFVTNETQVTKRTLVDKLKSLGYTLNDSEVFSPVPAMLNILKEKKLRPYLLVHSNTLEEFNGIDTSNPNCVVIGDAAEHFTYNNLNNAFRILLDQETDTSFYSLGFGKYYREDDGLVLDVGAFTTALEFAVGKKSILVGKPDKNFFQSALNDLGLNANETVMIGDDITSDVGGAQECGINGILVRTGKYRKCDENHPTVKPDLISNNLYDAVNSILL